MYNYDEAIRRLMTATNKIDGAYYLMARKLGVKENTLALLYALDDGKAHSQKQISDEWLIPKTTINTIVKELSDSGYLNLLSEKHTREKTIKLTEAGKKYTNKILQIIYKAENQALNETVDKFGTEFVEAFDFFADSLCNEFKNKKP